MKPSDRISDIAREIKANSARWINQKRFLKQRFEWQIGYGVFSYSLSHRDRVIKYIMNQKQHHKKKSFREEFLELLKKFEIEYDEKYLPEFYD